MRSLNYDGWLIQALDNDTTVGNFFASDKEGYPLYVGVVKDEATFHSFELPYTELVENRNSYTYLHNLKDKNEPPYSPVILFPNDDPEKEEIWFLDFFDCQTENIIHLWFS